MATAKYIRIITIICVNTQNNYNLPKRKKLRGQKIAPLKNLK